MANEKEVGSDEIASKLGGLLSSLRSAKGTLNRAKEQLQASGSARTDELRRNFRLVKLAMVKVFFDPSRYSSSESLTLSDWGAALRQRSFLKAWADRTADEAASLPIEDDEFREALLRLLLSPVRRLDENGISDRSFPSVREASAAKLWRVGNWIAEDFGLELTPSSGAEDGQWHQENELPKKLREPFSTAVPGFWWRLMEVDLLATDDDLVRQFKTWLSTERARLNPFGKPPKKLTDADRRQWVRHRVLGYIDLLLSAQAVGLRLTQQEIADNLFPDQYGKGGDEYIRKTVAPLARKLLSGPSLDALARADFE